MSNRKYLIKEKQYRPHLGMPYKRVALIMAKKINEMALDNFDDLDTERHAMFLLWRQLFKDEPFPRDADVLRRRFDLDPNLKSVQSA